MRRFWSWVKSKFKRRRPIVPITTTPTPIDYNGETISVQIHAMEGFTEEDAKKFKVAVELMVNIFNSLEFKLEVMNAPLVLTNGLKPSEVYALFMSGKDEYNEIADNDMDISITLYYKNNRTVGYTYPGTFRTWINRKFFGSYGYSSIVGNLTHEYCHNVGFGHPSRGYTQRNVPYFYGNVASDLCEQVLEGRKLTPLRSTPA